MEASLIFFLDQNFIIFLEFKSFCDIFIGLFYFFLAKIYHDIGLLYISEKLYESAAECFEQSLKSMEKELVESSIDKHLKATVLQNLGAVCNYMSSYQKAIDYHQKAIDIFGKCTHFRVSK